jgi:hypothetical protein
MRTLFRSGEIVANGGMEIGDPPTGWIAWAAPNSFERSSDQAHSGTYSCRIQTSNGSPDYRGTAQYLSKVSGEGYSLTFWYYITTGSFQYKLMNGNASDVLVLGIVSTTGIWTEVTLPSVVETITGTTGYVSFLGEPFTSCDFYIDDVSVIT